MARPFTVLSAFKVAIDEMCLEIAKVLLHIEDKYATEGFETLRVRAMTAILQRQPQKVSAFFIDMFYETNFSIRHRLDILQAIRIAAAELSALDPSRNAESKRTNKSSELEKPSWRKEVDQRVLAKTKYYHKVKPRVKETVENRFSPVCGSFFFPFLGKYDTPLATMKLLKEDSQVFANLLYTLGTVLHHSTHSPHVIKMARLLVGELCVQHLRHEDASVRQAVWFCVLVSVVAIPSAEVLLCEDDLTEVFVKYRISAGDVCENDPHEECRVLAGQFLMSIDKLLKSVNDS